MASSIDIAREVIQTEIEGLDYMARRLGSEFEVAINAIINTKGRTIICGMGKSGIIGKKIAASFASTGTPSFFMHPGEAFHGDLGMVKPEDVFIAISNSGETDEVLKLLPFLRDNDNFVIAITGKENSTLASNSHCHLDIAVPKEACPLQLAPTSSTTATLVMGDALTVALMDVRGFKPENFARFHPGGNLGKKLLAKVSDFMVSIDLPTLQPNSKFKDVLCSISSGGLGMSIILPTDSFHTLGVITDGDLRRAIEKYETSSFSLVASDLASIKPFTVNPDCKLLTAYDIMDREKIGALLVCDDEGTLLGVLKK
ncbi:SIS domain-containing protein [Vibrio cyclitrophicus]